MEAQCVGYDPEPSFFKITFEWSYCWKLFEVNLVKAVCRTVKLLQEMLLIRNNLPELN